ncbi:MAG: class II glutamine amidotransferase [Firmicutes bacterium]|nr:class II glutamine amidotransferase [Bacillota bacterium]
MCGIVGGVGNLPVREYLIKGLKTLDYRGYDSAGLAYADHKGIHVFRTPGRVSDLDAILPHEIRTSIGIGHTRWATHGAPTEANAHPHSSMSGVFVLVHNGVIENYRHLKNKLEAEGFTFKSETDTEVIANLL